jgi:hypothetical protein
MNTKNSKPFDFTETFVGTWLEKICCRSQFLAVFADFVLFTMEVDGVNTKRMTLASFLPHEHKETPFLTDSGVKTTFIFKENIKLQDIAAFKLHNNKKGNKHLKAYYGWHAELAHEADQPVGFVLESVTWKANRDWLKKLGYKPESLQDICTEAINLLKEI